MTAAHNPNSCRFQYNNAAHVVQISKSSRCIKSINALDDLDNYIDPLKLSNWLPIILSTQVSSLGNIKARQDVTWVHKIGITAFAKQDSAI